MLELSSDTRARVKELRELSDRAEKGEKGARHVLRRALRSSAPAVISACSDYSGTYRRVLIETAGGSDPLAEEGLRLRTEMMRTEIAGENATPLEVLLADRITSLWLLSETLEALVAAQFSKENQARVPMTYLTRIARIQESVHRRYVSSMIELARLRKLQANTPAVQFNTQINVGVGPNS